MSAQFRTNIVVPEVWSPEVNVEGNRVQRLLLPEVVIEVIINSTTIEGVLKASPTNASSHSDYLIIKNNRCDTTEYPELPVLKLNKPTDFDSISSDTILSWMRSPSEFIPTLTPSEVAKSWINKFSFREENEELQINGLRTPQVGALHAISAEFSKSTVEPCTIVLPTGTGKTETMLSTTIYHRCSKVLVLVPSNSLRDQIGEKFKTLGCLKELGVVEQDTL